VRSATTIGDDEQRTLLDSDALALAEMVSGPLRVMATLPARPDRDADQDRAAHRALATIRTARQSFMSRHAAAVYARLTDDHTRHLRLPDLLQAAATMFPGLVPTREQMAAERGQIQSDKDGYEIDQGIFFAAVLGSPVAGRHLIDAMLCPTPRAVELDARFAATGRIELGSVLVDRRGHAAHVTFCNAHSLNAEDDQLIADLETAIDLALLDDQVRVGVLRGAEVEHAKYRGRRVFSAGVNLKDLRNGDISFVEFLLGRELGYVNKVMRGLLRDPHGSSVGDRCVAKPWIAAVDTFAIGGGMQLLLVMDHVIAEEQAYFSLPAAEEGIVPGLANLRITRLVGGRLARRLILGGHRIVATDPEARLVCDEVVAPAAIDEAVDRAVARLAVPAASVNRRMLNLAEEPIELYREYLAEFASAQVARSYSVDVLAKVERRWQRAQGC